MDARGFEHLRLEVVRAPFALPEPPDQPFALLDVAFAGGKDTDKTHAFIERAGERLRLWVDHHEHPPAWARYESDPRFVLVPSRQARACPELVTPELVARARDVRVLLAHHDFDGLMAAVKFALGGAEPYPGADEDARAADSPGRGYVLSPRAARLTEALGEAGASLEQDEFADFYRAVAASLATGREAAALAARIDQLRHEARAATTRAENLAAERRLEAPGVCVLRLPAQLDRRMRREVLAVLERDAAVGLVLEGDDRRYWATAATYCDDIALDSAPDLDRGRHDFRFGPTKRADELVRALSRLAVAAGRA